jgi:hypothetical protein
MRTLSRNRCNMYPIDRLPVSHSIIRGRFSHRGRPSRGLRLGVFFDRSRAKPTIDSFSAARMTTFRQARGSLHLDRGDLTQSACQLVQSTVGLFFKPSDDRTSRNTERSFKSTQATALLIGPKNLFTALSRIAGWLWIVTTLASAGAATIFLLAIRRDSILVKRCIAAMTAYRCVRTHGVNPFSSLRHEQYTTPFDLRPLPDIGCRLRSG